MYNGNPLSRLVINRILLPEHGAFWFYTDMSNKIENVDIHSPYVHLFPGLIPNKKMQFDKDPIEVTPDMLKYNPKTKLLEVKNSIFPWSKPIWTKNCIFYGEIPKKSMSSLGGWHYDYHSDTIFICLNYFSEPKTFKVTTSDELLPKID